MVIYCVTHCTGGLKLCRPVYLELFNYYLNLTVKNCQILHMMLFNVMAAHVIFLPPGDVAASRIHAGLQGSLIIILNKSFDRRLNFEIH